MDTRRGVLGTIAGLTTVSLAGCSLLSGPIERSAEPAGLDEGTQDSTGFEHRRTKEFRLEQTVEVSGQSRDLRLTNYVVEYGKQISEVGPQGIQYVLFTTPSVSIAGEEANPFAEFNDKRLLQEIFGRADQSATDIQEVGTQTVTVLDSEMQFRIYEGTTTVEGQEIPIRIHFGRSKHDSDLLGALGVYPGILDEGETISEAARGTAHPVEFDS